MSGQKMNKTKTKICFSKGVHLNRALELSQRMGVGLTNDLGKYLGIPLFHKRVSLTAFAPILVKSSSRLSMWKRRHLTMAGRATLIKSVLASLPAYHMQTMLMPKKILKDLEKHSRSFLWGEESEKKKLHLVSWEQIALSKEEGGLGIKNLRTQNEAFILKLCWKLLVNQDALWVQLLRDKYKCGNLSEVEVSRSRLMSPTWKSICELWPKFKMGLGKKIGNGRSTSFWFENWAQTNRPLIEMIPGVEGWVDRNEKVTDFVDDCGRWDFEKLIHWFPLDVAQLISCAYPPCEERGEDKFVWKPSTDGSFSVKSAYSFLFAGTARERDSIWKEIWRWKVPEKIKSFVWLFAHNRIHTAKLRMSRGLLEVASCPFLCMQDEDAMHLIRDCPNARNRWRQFVNDNKWTEFCSLSGVDWVRWNLKAEAGKISTQKVKWNLLFGYVCWDIWVSRCNKLFDPSLVFNHAAVIDSLFKACCDQSLLSKPRFYGIFNPHETDMDHQREDHVKLEVDGSVLNSGASGCGGVLRTVEGNWIAGFACKLSNVQPAIAEILAIINGLNLCWNRGFRNVLIYSDCCEAIDFCIRGCCVTHPYKDVIDDARSYLHRDWVVNFRWISRNVIEIADYLANFSHSLIEPFCIFDQYPPQYLRVDLDEDD